MIKNKCEKCARPLTAVTEQLCSSCKNENSHKNGKGAFWASVGIAVLTVVIFVATGGKSGKVA